MESFAAAKRPLDPSAADWTETDGLTPASSSSKRRHLSSAVTPFKSPPPSLKPSPTEAVFRILCPADSTGGVIGKGGAIIRQFREETGAKIRIEDPVLGSEDRVIVIVADAQTKKKKDVSGGDGEGEDEASAAQRALVRVFERMLRVEEERLGEGSAGGGGEEKAIQGPVVCRLLAPSGQVGCVLGKGGKIIEKLRQETGAQIRVLAKEQVPVCAAAGDELIHITGSFSAVMKALFSVSSCLQDNLRTEPTIFATTKSFAATRGSGPPALGDPYAQRSYVPSPHGADYHPRVYSLNPGIDVVTPGNRIVPEEEVMFRMLCSNDKVGNMIGKGGVTIRALQSETGASVKVAISDSDENIILISARENADFKHSPAQEAVLHVHSRLVEPGVDKGSVVSARLLVPAQQIGCLLGKSGTIIAEMRRVTGANIRIFSKEQVPKCAQPNDQVVQVTGTFHSVQDALLHITSRIRETIFPLKPYASVGMTPYMSAVPEIPPPLLRSRIEPIPPGCYSTIGLSHSLDPSVGLLDPLDRQTPLSHGVDHIGADQIPFSYGRESSGLHPPYDRTSPRSWAPQAVSSGDPRGIPVVGINLDFRSETMGSGGQTAVMTSTTTKVVVPQHLLGFVYGEDGNNMTQIREISGAKVAIYDPKAGATEGKVVISGYQDQVQTAQSLLHAFILCGQGSS